MKALEIMTKNDPTGDRKDRKGYIKTLRTNFACSNWEK